MPSNHLILCCPLLLLPSIPPSIRVFSNESALPIRWPKYWSFSFNISLSSEYSGLISLTIDWLDFLSVQGTLKSLLQHHSSKPSIIRHSAFFSFFLFLFFFFLHVKYVLLSFKRAQGLVLNQAAHLSSVWHLSHHIKLASASNTSLNPKEKIFLILKKIQFWEQLTLFCNLKQYEG